MPDLSQKTSTNHHESSGVRYAYPANPVNPTENDETTVQTDESVSLSDLMNQMKNL
jgi:hypothetical protein